MREVTFVIHNNKAHGARVEFFRGDNREVIDIAYIIKTWGGPSDFVESVLKVEAAKTERLQADLAALRESNAALQAQLDAARVAVEKLPELQPERCANGFQCHCGARAANAARSEARRALKLKVGE